MDMSRLNGLYALHGLVEGLTEIVSQETYDGRPTTFGDCLKEWVKRHDVIEDVGGDPSTYLLVALIVLAKFHEDPSYFNESAATAITEIFRLGDTGGILPEALDPYKWKEWVFRRQCGLPLEF